MLYGWLPLASPAVESSSEAADEPARLLDFSLESLDGQTFASTRALSGRLALVAFWRTGQKHSLKLLEDLVKLRDELPEGEVVIVGVVSGAAVQADIKAIVDELGVDFPVLLDPDRRLYGQLRVIVSPTTWLVDEEGVLRFSMPGRRRSFATTARANIEFLRGRISEAERVKRTTQQHGVYKRLDSKGNKLHRRLARRLLASGKRKAAMEELRLAWETEPPLPEAGADLALLLLQDGRDAEALALLEQVLLRSPDDPRALGAKGVALIRTGHEQAGADLLRAALEREPAEPLLYYEMGRLSEGAAATDEARGYYRRGLEAALLGRQSAREKRPLDDASGD